MVVELDQPELGPVRLLGMPVKFSRTPGDATRPAPALGEHTREVLEAAGLDTERDRRAGRVRRGRGAERRGHRLVHVS